MTDNERITTFRRWKQYIKLKPSKYRICLHKEGDNIIHTLEELTRGHSFVQNPFYGVVTRYEGGLQYDWDIIEQLPKFKVGA